MVISLAVVRRLLQIGGWACVLIVAVLSLLPREMEVRTGLSPSLEHGFAYACTAGALAFAHQQWRWWVIPLALGAYSLGLEFFQGYVPGRHPSVSGVLSSTAGALLGAGLGRWLSSRGRAL